MAKPFNKLRCLMVLHGDTQPDLARLLGVSEATVCNRFRNAQPWTLPEMYKLLERYKVPYEDMCIVFPKDGHNEEPNWEGIKNEL